MLAPKQSQQEPVTATFAHPKEQADLEAKPQAYFEESGRVAKRDRLLTSTESEIVPHVDSGFAKKPSMHAFPALDISGIENDPFMRKESNLVVGTPFGEADKEILQDLFPGRDPSCKQFDIEKRFDLTGNDDSPNSNSAPNFDDIFGNNSNNELPRDSSPRSSGVAVNNEDYHTPQLEIEVRRKEKYVIPADSPK